MYAYLCAEEAGGCGVLWTPTSTRLPVPEPEAAPWAWCPDCVKTGAADVPAA